jgi:hypothetical protein
MGALSPLIKVDSIVVAVFPDSKKSLMSVPKVWKLQVPVVDGYFSVGPLNIEGAELPVGLYRVFVKGQGALLGEVAFEVGTWPNDVELNKIYQDIQNEKNIFADKEKSLLESKTKQLFEALNQLKENSKIASLPGKTVKWRHQIEAWVQMLNLAQQEQNQILQSPVFYPATQKAVLDFMMELSQAREALDAMAVGGPKMMQNKYKMGLGQLWVKMDRDYQALEGALRTLDKDRVVQLSVDAELIRRQLLEGDR